ncbi:MAG: cob(I)yrinic acid a,c-diamide adenosyltransferase [Candidatus Pacebacteria bacterium]|nr:cob(I)yrinic acid a,c-diamide adenosyltransferase [Candidatus Paceibacterota bacterium]
MLYTGKGDNGTTKTFGCDQRISKSSTVAEALGSLDEINSFLGLVKVESDQKFAAIIEEVQQNLFIIQAEVAGAEKHLDISKIKKTEEMIGTIEKELPPITTFFISGGTRLAALFDTARTMARRAERRVVGVHDENIQKISPETLTYLNRLSSLLYALARLTNHLSGITEEPPSYR